MPGVLAWGYYPTDKIWLPIQVDANGCIKADMTAINLDDLADVSVAAPTDGYVLYWDAATSLWKCKAAPAGTWASLTGKPDSPSLEELATEHEADGTHGAITPTSCGLMTAHVAAADPHIVYMLDSADAAAALAAAVQAGAITDGVTKAPTHDAVYDVKETAEAAQTAAEVATAVSDHAALTTGVHSFNKTCRLWNSAVQSIPNATATAVTFDTEKWDTDEMHSLVSNTHLITIQTAGKYLAVASVEFNVSNVGNRQVYIYKNDTELQIYAIDRFPAASGFYSLLTVFCFLNLAVNDTIHLKVYQNSGASLNIMSTNPYVPQLAVSRLP